MQNSKVKIIILILVAVAVVAGYFAYSSWVDKNSGPAQPNIISGEVTRLEQDRIYLKTTVLTSSPDQGVKVINEEKIVLTTPATEVVKEDPLAKEISMLQLSDVRVRTTIAVYYSSINADNEYIATKIVFSLPAEKYNVENLIKGLK